MGNVVGDSTWADDSRLNLDGAAARFYVHGNGSFVFSNGGIASVAGAVGQTDVKYGATLRMTGAATRLDTNLRVGDGATVGTVEIGDLQNDIVNLAAGSIVVTTTGTFRLYQTGDTTNGPRGGLRQGGQQFGTFTNQGTFVRAGETTGPFAPQLDYVVTNTGMFRLTPNSNLRLLRADADGYGLINQSGLVELYYGSKVDSAAGPAYKQVGGSFQTVGDPTTGAGSTFFQVKSDFLGGNIQVNRNGGFGTLEFGANDVKLANSVVVYIEVNGSTQHPNEMGDQINLGGAATLTIDNSRANKPQLNINTLVAQPAAGWTFDIVNAPNLVGTFDPGSISFQGQTPPGGYSVSYPFGPPREIRISA